MQMAWVLVDDVLGIVMNGAIASDAGGGHGLAGGTMVSEGVSVTVASATVTASAMASQSLGIVAVEELDST